jgi:hypothetical protein
MEPSMATINQQKIYSHTGLAAGASMTYTWKNYPQHTTLAYFAEPVPPPVSGPHGAASGTVEITRVVVTYQRNNYEGDHRHVEIHVTNSGSGPTGFDLWESWIS